MPTHDERNRATRSALIAAARSLFAELGYGQVAVIAIAERAGVTTGALYHQFGSKRELFKAVYSELVEGVAAAVLIARGGGDEPTLLGDCEAYMAACADPAFNRITIDAPAVIGWDQILDEAQSTVQASLRDAEDRGALAAKPTAPLARMLAAALKEAAVIVATAEDPDQARRAAAESLRQLITGLLAPGAQGLSAI
jgi:AcrR family transcriptional regulator